MDMEEKEQIPIFIPIDEIETFPDPMEMPDNAGRLELIAKSCMATAVRTSHQNTIGTAMACTQGLQGHWCATIMAAWRISTSCFAQ